MTNAKLLACHCYSLDHTIRVSYDTAAECPMFWIEIILSPHPSFWRRLRTGLKYALGKNHGSGCVDEFAFDLVRAGELHHELRCFLESNSKGERK